MGNIDNRQKEALQKREQAIAGLAVKLFNLMPENMPYIKTYPLTKPAIVQPGVTYPEYGFLIFTKSIQLSADLPQKGNIIKP